MNIVSLDLELNQPSGKIIEIGIVVANINTKEVIDKRSFLVNPEEELSDYIVILTGITPYMLHDKKNLTETYKDVVAYLAPFKIQRQPITWGAGDIPTLKRQLNETGVPYEWCFGYREMDVKCLVQAHRQAIGASLQGGLAKSLTRYGLSFQGTKHRATDDAFNTLRLYFLFLDMMKNL